MTAEPRVDPAPAPSDEEPVGSRVVDRLSPVARKADPDSPPAESVVRASARVRDEPAVVRASARVRPHAAAPPAEGGHLLAVPVPALSAPAVPVIRGVARVVLPSPAAQPAADLVRWSAPAGRGWPVVVPAVVRGVAAVPGALSMPHRRPGGSARAAGWDQVAGSTGMPGPAGRALRLRSAVPSASSPSASPARADLGRRSGTGQGGRDASNPVPGRGSLRRLGARAALPTATAVVAAFVAGTGYLAVGDRPVPDIGRWGIAAAMAPLASSAGQDASPFGGVVSVVRAAPSRLRIKEIGIDTGLEKLHLGANGALVPPRAFDDAGWYADGTAPGEVGPAVIAGHVDSRSGPAVFYRLRELTAGDRIEVVVGDTVLRFVVVRAAWYPKARFPTAQVYGPTPDRQLRLITCGGVFDRSLRSYRDNLVVYAVAG